MSALNDLPVHAISLCAGIGGIDLGLAAAIPGYTTALYVEREAFCAAVLAARMADGSLDEAPIWDDVTTFDARPWRGIDIVTAGFPCPPFSLAGKRLGQKDPRHLWPHIARIIAECRPAVAFLENVPGLVSLGLRDVCADLRGMGYDVSAGIFSAAECGAPHVRKRLFIYAANAAHKKSGLPERRPPQDRQKATGSTSDGKAQHVADAVSPRRSARPCQPFKQVRDQARGQEPQRQSGDVADADAAERRSNGAAGCAVGRRGDGVPHKRQQGHREPPICSEPMADANGSGPSQRQGVPGDPCAQQPPTAGGRRDAFKPFLGQSPDGLPGWLDGWEDGVPRTCVGDVDRNDKLRALGNAVVPATAALAWQTLSSY
jgi:DNA (cytosine-5)-methyltransferase 1